MEFQGHNTSTPICMELVPSLIVCIYIYTVHIFRKIFWREIIKHTAEELTNEPAFFGVIQQKNQLYLITNEVCWVETLSNFHPVEEQTAESCLSWKLTIAAPAWRL